MTSGTVTAYLGLGSNLQDRQQLMYTALSLISRLPHTHIERCSSLYETDPVGYIDQPKFLNMTVALRTALNPLELLQKCMEIEQKLGRTRELRWGPRTIDLDILIYSNQEVNCTELHIPHPRMKERAFVLIPLLEVLPEQHPYKVELQTALGALDDKEGVRLWKEVHWPEEFELSVN